MTRFTPSPVALDTLRAADPLLGAAIDRIGPVGFDREPDLFRALVWTILGQQISGPIQKLIFGRVEERVGSVAPAAMIRLAPEGLRACGMSMRKAICMVEAARAFEDGRLDPGRLAELPDEAVCAELIRVRGIGRWTAEMLLLFSLGRPDVLSFEDLGLRRGVERLYGPGEATRERWPVYTARYSPYGTTASLYLWRITAEAAAVM